MSRALNFAAFRSVPPPAETSASRGDVRAESSDDEHVDRLEDGPGLFRCILVCSLVALTFYCVAAWVIV